MTSDETKVCQNCRQPFVINASDFAFYERIQVPPPTWCPECRFRRRLAFINIFNLYKRVCGLCKQEYISMYDPKTPHQAYCPKCWWSDGWDAMEYGRGYDFNRSFFGQVGELWREVPLLGLSLDYPNNINAPYVNFCGPMKNSSLVFYGEKCEDVVTGYYLVKVTDMLDSSVGMESGWLYDSRNFFRCNHCVGIKNVQECINSFFLQNCRNCQDCFGSANIKNKKYVYFNEQLTKEAYTEKIKQWDLGSYAVYQEVRKLAEEHWKKYPPRPIWMDLSVNSTGNYTFESKNCKECYEVQSAEDCKYMSMVFIGPNKHCYDISGWGNNMELCYEGSCVGEYTSNVKFCQESGLHMTDSEYSKVVTGSSHVFGCVAVRKKQYCVLNRQYTREDYEALVAKIKERMKTAGEYGEFFPITMSPHAYNETLAQSFFPLTEEQAFAKGYRWREPDGRTYPITKQAADLPDHIRDADESVLKEVIKCTTCKRGYKITPMELGFLKQMNVPLPRRCPFCRIDEKFKEWIKQMRLIDRVCDTCKKSFRTPYTADEYPHILCKPCWTNEYN